MGVPSEVREEQLDGFLICCSAAQLQRPQGDNQAPCAPLLGMQLHTQSETP